ncbi:MAG: 30S ribosomal protein S8 [Candidatus Jorgensenbacteria bacterium]|nr:30S ribosomal protein S8 [Candidatus Jorgensenbacteria bacterium]
MYINFLIQLKNAVRAGKKSAKLPYTVMDLKVAEVLARHGFLKNVEVKGRAPQKIIEVEFSAKRPIRDVRFKSTPSVARYAGYREVRQVKQGHGLLVLTTPKGVRAGHEARKEKVGGKLLFEIW